MTTRPFDRHLPGLPPRRFSFAPWTALPAVSRATSRSRTRPECVGIGDRVVALAGIIALAPVFLLCAVAIKLASPRGPIVYRQERVGLDRRRAPAETLPLFGGEDRRRAPGLGRSFTILKFRTMVHDAERSTGPVWATESDPRVTPVGRVLRHLRLDELPQLFNVLFGHMRLVGPRPERPHFVHQLLRNVPNYGERLRVLPGITGLAQIERDYDGTVDDVRRKVQYDLFYAQNRSSLLDLKIVLRTIDVMLRGRGAR